MKTSLSLLAASLVLVLGVSTIVVAEDTIPRTFENVPKVSPEDVERGKNLEDLREEISRRVSEKKQSAADKRQAIQQRVAEKKVEMNTERCERNQELIEKLIPKLATAATTHKRVLDTMYDRVVSFYENSTLTVEASDYQQLIGAIEQARVDSELSIQVMQDAEVIVDCQASGIGAQLSEYRTAVAQARASLASYRTALVELIKSLKAAPSQSTDAGTANDDVDRGAN